MGDKPLPKEPETARADVNPGKPATVFYVRDGYEDVYGEFVEAFRPATLGDVSDELVERAAEALAEWRGHVSGPYDSDRGAARAALEAVFRGD